MFLRLKFLCFRRPVNNLSSLSHINWSSRYSSVSTNRNHSNTLKHSTDSLVTVWWDSSCPLCLREINLIKKWAIPGTITFVDIASPNSTCPLNRQIMLARFHVQERDGQIVHGAEAFALLWKHIPRMERFGLYLNNNPKALDIFERFYTYLFLPYLRPLFQKIFRYFGFEGKKYT